MVSEFLSRCRLCQKYLQFLIARPIAAPFEAQIPNLVLPRGPDQHSHLTRSYCPLENLNLDRSAQRSLVCRICQTEFQFPGNFQVSLPVVDQSERNTKAPLELHRLMTSSKHVGR